MVLQMVGKCLEYFEYVLWEYLEVFLKMFWKCPGIVLENVLGITFTMFSKDVWDWFGMVFQTLWNCATNILDMFQKCAENIEALFFQIVWHLCGIVFENPFANIWNNRDMLLQCYGNRFGRCPLKCSEMLWKCFERVFENVAGDVSFWNALVDELCRALVQSLALAPGDVRNVQNISKNSSARFARRNL